MNHSLKTGLSFGLTSGIITTLGLMVGLEAGTNSKLAVIGGVLTIAIADACSDALGIHMSEEAENQHTPKEIWSATASTFLAKALFASLFIIPILLLPLGTAIIVSIAFGLAMLGLFSFYLARQEKKQPGQVIFEHLSVAVGVVVVTHLLGKWIARVF